MTNTDVSLAVIEQNSGLTPEVYSKLDSFEDYVNFYIQLEEVSSGFSWMKADVLLQMEQKMGDKSLKDFSQEVKQPLSTTTNYIRVARAFPTEKRDPGASFSLHFQASFADSYNEDTKDFKSEKRFDWLAKAMDSNMSTRRLSQEIQKEKQRELIADGDTEAKNKQAIKEVLHDIQLSLGAIVQKAHEGSQSHFDKLVEIKNFIYGKN